VIKEFWQKAESKSCHPFRRRIASSNLDLHINTWFRGPTWVNPQTASWSVQTDRQTDRPRYSVCSFAENPGRRLNKICNLVPTFSSVRALRIIRHQHARSGVFGLYIGWSDITVIYGHDTISMLYGIMSYCAKLTGKDLIRYLNKTEWVGLRTA